MTRVQVWVSNELATDVFKTGWQAHFECVKGLPDDSRIVDAFLRDDGRTIALIFDCLGLDNVTELSSAKARDVSLPILTPVYRSLD